MSTRLLAALLLVLLSQQAPAAEGRFRTLAVYVDVGAKALAAYQVEIRVESGAAEIVGVEGGEHEAFAKAPYYDPAALNGGRIILAAFSTQAILPSGKARVATLHVRESQGLVTYSAHLIAAGDAHGSSVDAAARINPEGDDE